MIVTYLNLFAKYIFFYSSCNICDTLFNTSMSLEYHKDEYGHWTSDDEDDDYDEEEEELGNILLSFICKLFISDILDKELFSCIILILISHFHEYILCFIPTTRNRRM